MPKRKPSSPRRPRKGGNRRAAKELAGLFRQILHHVGVIEEETEWVRKLVEVGMKEHGGRSSKSGKGQGGEGQK